MLVQSGVSPERANQLLGLKRMCCKIAIQTPEFDILNPEEIEDVVKGIVPAEVQIVEPLVPKAPSVESVVEPAPGKTGLSSISGKQIELVTVPTGTVSSVKKEPYTIALTGMTMSGLPQNVIRQGLVRLKRGGLGTSSQSRTTVGGTSQPVLGGGLGTRPQGGRGPPLAPGLALTGAKTLERKVGPLGAPIPPPKQVFPVVPQLVESPGMKSIAAMLGAPSAPRLPTIPQVPTGTTPRLPTIPQVPMRRPPLGI